jgi:16S rRNA (cytidine1402-2'-O)-methyltransferase
MAAVASAGLPTDRFFFEGFLPPREQARRARLAELADVPATLVLFETGPRIAAMLHDLAAVFGDREAAVCRELTKLHEEIRRADLASLARAYDEGAETRGEFVVSCALSAAPMRTCTDSDQRSATGRQNVPVFPERSPRWRWHIRSAMR